MIDSLTGQGFNVRHACRTLGELKHGRGIQVGHNAVELIMRELGIKGTPTPRLPRGARVAQVTSLDLVRRVFARDRPNQLWLTDITEHPTNEGKIYCCVVRDSFSRLVSDRLRAAGIAPSMGAADAGRPASSSPAASTTTSPSTTPAADTPRSGCSPQPRSKLPGPPTKPSSSSNRIR